MRARSVQDHEHRPWGAAGTVAQRTADGVSIADKDEAFAWGREIAGYRTRFTVEAVRKALGEPAR